MPSSIAKESTEVFRRTMKCARRFKDYNVREYLVRRARERFREPTESGEQKEAQLRKAKEELSWMERQEKVYGMYGSGVRSVLDKGE